MGARVDHTRNTYFIYGFDEPEEAGVEATVGNFPEDWPDIEEECPFSDDDIVS